jgi:hypothetical protein
MPITPGYGETPVPDDDVDALLQNVRELLGDPVSKAAVYDLEQAVQEEATEELLTSVIDERRTSYWPDPADKPGRVRPRRRGRRVPDPVRHLPGGDVSHRHQIEDLPLARA